MGSPAKVVRMLTPEQIATLQASAAHYVQTAPPPSRAAADRPTMSELHKFLFDGLPVRGMLVRLTDGWQEVLQRRQEKAPWPPEVSSLVGQMCAAGVLMQSNIKFDGALVLQISGDGPVKLAVAEVQPNLRFRGTATLVGEVPAGAQLEAMVNLARRRVAARSRWTRATGSRGSSPIRASWPCTATGASRCSSCPRCWSTTCCSPSSSTHGWCWPPTAVSPRAC